MLNRPEPKPLLSRILVVIAVGSIAVLAALFVLAFTVDGKWDVEESVLVNVPASRIYPLVSSTVAWERWSIWNEVDMPSMKREFKGPALGVGSTVEWDRGLISGVTRISSVADDQQIGFSISFDQRREFAEGRIVLRNAEGGTEVFMRIRGDTHTDPIAKLAVLYYKPTLKREMNISLTRLRDKIEKTAGLR